MWARTQAGGRKLWSPYAQLKKYQLLLFSWLREKEGRGREGEENERREREREREERRGENTSMPAPPTP